MNAPSRLAAFGAELALAFGGAALAGARSRPAPGPHGRRRARRADSLTAPPPRAATPGRYRRFLRFKVGGEVRTVACTVVVAR